MEILILFLFDFHSSSILGILPGTIPGTIVGGHGSRDLRDLGPLGTTKDSSQGGAAEGQKVCNNSGLGPGGVVGPAARGQ